MHHLEFAILAIFGWVLPYCLMSPIFCDIGHLPVYYRIGIHIGCFVLVAHLLAKWNKKGMDGNGKIW